MKMTFAIDCDEVLRSLLSNMISLYNREFNENIEYDDVKDFVVDVSFPKIQETTGITASQWFFQDHSTELFMESEALPKVKEAIEIAEKVLGKTNCGITVIPDGVSVIVENN